MSGRFATAALAPALCVFWLTQPASALTLTVRDASGSDVFSAPLPPDGRWCLLWNHSVTGDPVIDCFRADAGRMLLERSHQIDFSAAGLGHIPGRGVVEADRAGGQWIENIDAALPDDKLVLRIGTPRVDHRIRIAGRITNLSDLAPGARVAIALEGAEQ